MNKQPHYHRLEILFTATDDFSEKMRKPAFRKKLASFLREQLGTEVIAKSVDVEYCDAEAGDPHDLM